MKIAAIISITVIIAWALLTILQVWIEVVSGAVYLKLSMTAGIIVIVSMVIGLAVKDYLSEKKMKDDGFIDS
ncbi:hypothetical protein MTYP_02614 [Methylophilaceae bacterium]|nr:hypothetical protein MTYP_02614 [Methylophilaceae bacterium]